MRFFPKKDRSFELLNQLASIVTQGTELFKIVLPALPGGHAQASAVQAQERLADAVVHATAELLHRTFITPFDREDIRSLSSRLDDVLDWVDAAAQRLVLFEIAPATPETGELASICTQAMSKVKEAVSLLDRLQESERILRLCREINELEDASDEIFRRGLARLFRDEPDTRQLIKHKEIYECLEKAVDACEDCANIIEGIVLEYG